MIQRNCLNVTAVATILAIIGVFNATIANAQPPAPVLLEDVVAIEQTQLHLKEILSLRQEFESATTETNQLILSVTMLDSMGEAGIPGLLHICNKQHPKLQKKINRILKSIITNAKAALKLRQQLEEMDTLTSRAFLQHLNESDLKALIKGMKETQRRVKEGGKDIKQGCDKIRKGAGGQ